MDKVLRSVEKNCDLGLDLLDRAGVNSEAYEGVRGISYRSMFIRSSERKMIGYSAIEGIEVEVCAIPKCEELLKKELKRCGLNFRVLLRTEDEATYIVIFKRLAVVYETGY